MIFYLIGVLFSYILVKIETKKAKYIFTKEERMQVVIVFALLSWFGVMIYFMSDKTDEIKKEG